MISERQIYSTGYALPIYMTLSSDHTSAATGKTLTVTISKNLGAFATASGTINEVGNGWYKLEGHLADRNTVGPLAVHAAAADCDNFDGHFAIVHYNPFGTAMDASGIWNFGTRGLTTASNITTNGVVIAVNASGQVEADIRRVNSSGVSASNTIDANIVSINSSGVNSIWSAANRTLTSAANITSTSGTIQINSSGYVVASNASASGGLGLSAAEVWAYGDRTLTGADNITSNGGTLTINASGQVQADLYRVNGSGVNTTNTIDANVVTIGATGINSIWSATNRTLTSAANITSTSGAIQINTSGYVTAGTVASGAITLNSIATGSITNAKFGVGAIDQFVIADLAINSAKFANDAITSSVIAASAISSISSSILLTPANKLATNASGYVTSTNVASGGGGGATAQEIWEYGTRTITSADNITEGGGVIAISVDGGVYLGEGTHSAAVVPAYIIENGVGADSLNANLYTALASGNWNLYDTRVLTAPTNITTSGVLRTNSDGYTSVYELSNNAINQNTVTNDFISKVSTGVWSKVLDNDVTMEQAFKAGMALLCGRRNLVASGTALIATFTGLDNETVVVRMVQNTSGVSIESPSLTV